MEQQMTFEELKFRREQLMAKIANDTGSEALGDWKTELERVERLLHGFKWDEAAIS